MNKRKKKKTFLVEYAIRACSDESTLTHKDIQRLYLNIA